VQGDRLAQIRRRRNGRSCGRPEGPRHNAGLSARWDLTPTILFGTASLAGFFDLSHAFEAM
jgi:hypothetical protein